MCVSGKLQRFDTETNAVGFTNPGEEIAEVIIQPGFMSSQQLVGKVNELRLKWGI
jgi:hypothetical protein